ncbi:MAG: MarR family transcriptional regulator [Pseudomonadota bacterium]
MAVQDFALEAFLPYRLSLLSNTVSEGIAATYRDEHGLSVTEWRVIAILGRFPGVTATDVMARAAMDKVAVSRAVSRLVDKSLVQRNENAQDRRRVGLRLTRRGVRTFNAVVPKAHAYEQRLLAELSAEERATLNHLIDTLQARARGLDAE